RAGHALPPRSLLPGSNPVAAGARLDARGRARKTRRPIPSQPAGRRRGDRRTMSSYLLLSTLNFSLGGLVFLLGFLILRENPRQRLKRIVDLMLFFGGVGAVLAAASFLAARSGARTAATTSLLENLSYVWEFLFPELVLLS